MKKVLVIGDSCVDVFKYGTCKRICPEAPVPVFQPTKNMMSSGMTSNVFANLKALNVECELVTNPVAPKKIRYVDAESNQMLLRVDKQDDVKEIEYDRIRNIDFTDYEAIIISDYDKGFLSEDDIEYIGNQHSLTFMDTKKKLGAWASSIKVIKINEREYNENVGWFPDDGTQDIIMTKGKDGAILNKTKRFPIKKEHPVRDLSGAGDTFLAALVAKYIENYDICDSIEFANKCASWVVTQKGIAVINLNEINE